MRIGYSFWGFLGHGITDTPDGGRSHRRTLIDGLAERGHTPVFLQSDRDLTEAGEDFTETYTWHEGFPEIDALVLEWRWPIGGRNTTPCTAPNHTCDLHRQTDLVDFYIHEQGLPTLVWDKDQHLPPNDPLRTHPAVTVCEAALYPAGGAHGLLFPVHDDAVQTADPEYLALLRRDLPLVYAGNQYDRDQAFTRLFAPAAHRHRHLVAGKWPRTTGWPHVAFIGRRPFAEVQDLHRRSVTTMLLAPERYSRRGQFTQRLFEAVLAGCLPLGASDMRGIDQILPADLIVTDGHEAARRIDHLTAIAGTPRHAQLIAACLDGLESFLLSRQLPVIESCLAAIDHEGAHR